MMTMLVASVALLGLQGTSINDYVQPNFKDASFQIKLVFGNQDELAKINKDFGTSYRFKTMDAKLKEPFMLRLTGSVEDTDVLFIQNGVDRLYSIPKMHIKQRENLDDEPGKRQTPLDFGFLTPSMFAASTPGGELFESKFVRNDRATGDMVFDITYNPKYKYRSYYRVWIDPQKHYITKREWYRKERQLATFFYSEPVNQQGVWLPTHLLVKNVDNVRAGETEYVAIKLNTGLDDSLFKAK
jgi:hypothetical protein